MTYIRSAGPQISFPWMIYDYVKLFSSLCILLLRNRSVPVVLYKFNCSMLICRATPYSTRKDRSPILLFRRTVRSEAVSLTWRVKQRVGCCQFLHVFTILQPTMLFPRETYLLKHGCTATGIFENNASFL